MSEKDNVASPYEMKEQDKNVKKLTPTTRSYLNGSFLQSRDARTIRILCEFLEPAHRLNENNVKGTILLFGSARAMPRGDFDKTLAGLLEQLATCPPQQKKELEIKIERFKKVEWMCEWNDKAEELARMLTEWSLTDPRVREMFANSPDYLGNEMSVQIPAKQPLVITTGGGPGMMEAANRGAASVPGAITMGMGISLPFEKGLNPYVSDDFAFEFHYFFTRKFWMMYGAKALIIGPGGFGTMDELFELMTLKQTGKLPDLPIVLFGSNYWKTIVNWQAIADFGTISQKEVDDLFFADTAKEAFDYISANLLAKNSHHQAISPSLSAYKTPSAAPPMKL